MLVKDFELEILNHPNFKAADGSVQIDFATQQISFSLAEDENQLVLNWVNNFGDSPTTRECLKVKVETNKDKDLSWLFASLELVSANLRLTQANACCYEYELLYNIVIKYEDIRISNEKKSDKEKW